MNQIFRYRNWILITWNQLRIANLFIAIFFPSIKTPFAKNLFRNLAPFDVCVCALVANRNSLLNIDFTFFSLSCLCIVCIINGHVSNTAMISLKWLRILCMSEKFAFHFSFMETKVWMLFGRAMKIYIFVPKNLSKTEWNWFRISAVEIFVSEMIWTVNRSLSICI